MPRNASKQLPLKMVTAARVFPPACFEQAVNTIRHRLWRIRRLSAKFPILSASFYFGFTLNFNDWLHWSPMWILYIVSLFLSTFSTDRYLTNSIHSTTFTVRISISTNSRRTFVSDCRLYTVRLLDTHFWTRQCELRFSLEFHSMKTLKFRITQKPSMRR